MTLCGIQAFRPSTENERRPKGRPSARNAREPDLFSLVPVHKRAFFGGVEGQRVGQLSAGPAANLTFGPGAGHLDGSCLPVQLKGDALCHLE
jgi:hypothetical protein